MGFDDLCNTGLVLGLGFSQSSSSTGEHKRPPAAAAQKHISGEPSLTLSLSGEAFDLAKKSGGGDGQDTSAASSVKREREETERVISSSRVISDEDVDDDDGSSRKKLRLTKTQSALLEQSFKLHTTLNPKQKQELARELKLRPRQVEVWFQNRRARTKLKQTEVDCEFLKKCCETLTDENRRLQKEVEALKSAQPLYMHLPAATLTMCPSCERIAAAAPDNPSAANTAFVLTPKPHFYNHFTNSSAAC